MKLADHGLQLNSRQKSESIRIRTETSPIRLRLPQNRNGGFSPEPHQNVRGDFLSQLKGKLQSKRVENRNRAEDHGSLRDFKIKIVKMILEAFELRAGKRNGTNKSEIAREEKRSGSDYRSDDENSSKLITGRIVAARDIFYERSSIAVGTNGWVTLEDGRRIAFSAQLEMSRTEYKRVETQIRIDENPDNPLVIDQESILEYRELVTRIEDGVTMSDPLVINLDGKGAALTDIKIFFDLDGDGTKERIPGLADGSWFLAVDRNKNENIDTGLELFGPRTEHGFAELAEYDEDGNKWIDENDPIFSMLRLWRPGENAGRKLPAMDLGGIYLNAVPGVFDLHGDTTAIQGRMREHSIWLRESSGEPGFIHEMDLRI